MDLLRAVGATSHGVRGMCRDMATCRDSPGQPETFPALIKIKGDKLRLSLESD